MNHKNLILIFLLAILIVLAGCGTDMSGEAKGVVGDKEGTRNNISCGSELGPGEHFLEEDLYCDFTSPPPGSDEYALSMWGSSTSCLLDCQGHMISNTDIVIRTAGIGAHNPNVIIKNCRIQNFYWGIFGTVDLINSVIENNTLKNNTIGILILGYSQAGYPSNNLIINNYVVQNKFSGVEITGGYNNVFKDNVVAGNGETGTAIGIGVSLFAPAMNNTIEGNTFDDNACSGIGLFDNPYPGGHNTTRKNIIKNNIFKNNGWRGTDCAAPAAIKLYHSSYNLIINNTITNDSSYGIGLQGDYPWPASNYNIIKGNVIIKNRHGIGIYGNSQYNFVSDNQACDNFGSNVADFYCDYWTTLTKNNYGSNNFFDTVQQCYGGWPAYGIDYHECGYCAGNTTSCGESFPPDCNALNQQVCCGDDSGENYRFRDCADTHPPLYADSCSDDQNDAACCDAGSDCVVEGVCYTTNTAGSFQNNMWEWTNEAGTTGYYKCLNTPSHVYDCDQDPNVCENLDWACNVDVTKPYGRAAGWAFEGENAPFGGYGDSWGRGIGNGGSYDQGPSSVINGALDECCGDDQGEYLITSGTMKRCCNAATDTLDANGNCITKTTKKPPVSEIQQP
jgi:parallel beta-helix repeat protein